MSEASFTFYRETNLKEVELNGRKVRIPVEWEVVRIQDIVKKIKAGGTPKTSRREYYENGTIPFVKIEDLTGSGKYLTKTKLFITEAGLKNSNAWIIPENSLLFAMYGSIGESAINRIPVATNQAILGIIPDPNKSDVEFLYYRLKFSVPEMKRQTKHGVQPNLTAKIVREFQIPLPPLEEQKRIAGVLRAIDEAIQVIDESIAKLERLRKGAMEELLTRGLNHKKFKQVELNGRKVRIPVEWEVVELGKITDINKESVDPRRAFPDKEFIYIDIDSVENGTGKIRNPKRLLGKNAPSRARRVVHVNDVIMSTVRPYLKAFAIIPKEYEGQICSTGFAVLTPHKNKLDPWYLLYSLFSDNTIAQCNKMMVGGQYPALTNTQVSQIKILLPPLEEQKRIAEILRTIDGAIEAKRQKKEKLERMKKAVMEKLLTGEIRVR